MASMEADKHRNKLDMSKEELEAYFNDPEWDTTSVRGLAKLLSEVLQTCVRNAIKKITENGYTKEDAEQEVLKCGPFHDTEGNLESHIVERTLLSLDTYKRYDFSFYRFQDINNLVEFMTLEMVTKLRKIKPILSVSDAIWRLLMCDLNIIEANKAEIEVGSSQLPGSKNQEIATVKKCDDNTCSCKNFYPVSIRKRDNALRNTATLLLEKPFKGRTKGLKKRFSSLKSLSLVDQLYSSCSSDEQINTSFLVNEAGNATPTTPKPDQVLPSKSEDHEYLKSIPRDEKGEYLPRDDNDILKLDLVARIQESEKELQRWGDWAKSKIMEVTKRLTQHRKEVNMLKTEKEEAMEVMKDNEAMEENTARRLLETTRSLNNTNNELIVANSTIFKLQSEQEVIREEMEREKNRSLIEAKRLEQALIKEEEALKKSQSFGSEKTALEDELKVLKRQVDPKQRELEKAKCILKETEIRVAKDEREIAKAVKEAESIKNERERLEALAIVEYEIMKEKVDEELKNYETEKKGIEDEISALKSEAESKRIAAMQKSMNMNSGSSKRLEVFRNMEKKKKEERECVMCLHEEMTVVFYPCGHQVLCEACDVKHHEKWNDCPACRTLIEKRISVRFAKS